MNRPPPAAQPLEANSVLSAYRPLPGVPDEMMDQTGTIRPVWHQFISHFAKLSPEEIAARFAQGDQYLRDAGVFYRQYSDAGSAERDWPLSHIPVLLDEAEWTALADGLTQRADLLEAVVADLYGENRLVREGHLPASLVAGCKHWLRPMVGITPRSGHFLKFIAFEVGRGPDGAWWVLGDRTEAPSGAGFALENRVATSRVFSDLYPQANVQRLAGFFQAFKNHLRALRADTDSQIAILTPGQLTDTYFEHAYIARYLGFMLLEGEDLTVADGRLMVRTVAGLSPISVLWRRLDSTYADPMELDETSALGTPGLVQALRNSQVTMVNALGVGVLEMRALLAFLPRISLALRGEPLKIANIATWWCGQASERAHVHANLHRMILGQATSTRLTIESDDQPSLGQYPSLEALLEAEGRNLVGQEAVSLSTTPAFVDGKLAPRPMTLRVFLARDANGWQIMPGGYARIGRAEVSAAISMQHGGSAADVWVVSNTPVKPVSLLPTAEQPFRRTEASVLPARAADNLYWLGRYIERAEGAIRLLRAFHLRLGEAGGGRGPVVAAIAKHLHSWEIDLEQAIPDHLLRTISAAIASASHVRDRFSMDGWMALTDLARTANRMSATATIGTDTAAAMSVLLRKITGFSGLVHDNMHRSHGWLFMSIGRSLERAFEMCTALAAFADPNAPEGTLDLAVELGDSAMTHRRRYAVATNRNTVIDLLALDTLNPRAIIFHLTRIREHAAELPGTEEGRHLSALSRAVLRAQTGLMVHTPESLDTNALLQSAAEIANLSDVLSLTYFK
ncbi:MAG: circularly permuted type 2 ATP-grasp protein [Caulobacterales bacterium]